MTTLPEDLSNSCVRFALRFLLVKHPPTEIMAQAQRELSAASCHFVGHALGEEVYNKYHSAERTLTECPETCEGACIHGGIGAVLMDASGVKIPKDDLRHLDLSLIINIGTNLCVSIHTCHALGHAFFRIFGEFDKTLAMCDSIVEDGDYHSCYSGVFMENSMRNSLGGSFSGAVSKEFRDSNELLSPCPSVAEKYQNACYHHLFFNQAKTFAELGITDPATQMRLKGEACDRVTYPSARVSCFAGVGMSGQEIPSFDMVQFCLSFSKADDQAGCIFGFSNTVADYVNTGAGEKVCDSITDDKIASACYSGVFKSASIFDPASLDRLCSTGKPSCTKTLVAYHANPRSTFAAWR